ncbi:hypothetical protein BC943DRAFT_316576 [Umbelopsis sp. AD052]|nr:hypothetical protein BC943DRAFT_316576 [Umbelopsis sp. AD052]
MSTNNNESITENQSEFPPLGSQSPSSLDRSSGSLSNDRSWADIAEEVPKDAADHRPNAWENTKDHASYAEVAEHQNLQDEEFPTPQQATEQLEKAGELEPAPKSQGVSDILEEQHHKVQPENPIEPPNPDRSYASATENRDFPPLDETAKDQEAPQSNDLSELPDVNEMLNEDSVKIPPPPPAQSFAKIAAKTPPPEEPKEEELKEEIKPAAAPKVQKVEAPKPVKPNFPPLEDARDTNSPVTDLSDLPSAHDMLQEKSVKDNAPERSFAEITKENLKDAPPSAKAKPVDTLPVFNEDEILKEETRREARKYVHGGEDANVAPEMERAIEVAEAEEIDEEEGKGAVMRHISYFDRKQRGKITLFDTFVSLRGLGYNFFITLPTTFVIHLRLSPLTSPYSIPFIYRSIVDILTLPIYTKVLPRILARTPLLTSGQTGKKLEEVLHTFGRRVKVSELGLRKGIDGLSTGAAEARQNDTKMEQSMGAQDLINVEGLSFWDGLRAMHAVGKEKGLVWSTTRWAVNKVQWIATYSMLHDPAIGVVTRTTLKDLYSA